MWFFKIHVMTPIKQSITGGEKDCIPFETSVHRSKTYDKVCFLPMGWIHSCRDFLAIVFRTITCIWQETQPLQVIALRRNFSVLLDNFCHHSLQVLHKFNEFFFFFIKQNGHKLDLNKDIFIKHKLKFMCTYLRQVSGRGHRTHETYDSAFKVLPLIYSRCLHSFSFNLSRIKFLIADWIGLFRLTYFSSPFPYLSYRLVRDPWARSKRVAVAQSFFGLCIFPPSVFALFCVLCRSFDFLNRVFTLEQPYSCAATSFIFDIKCTMLAFVIVVFVLSQYNFNILYRVEART